MPLTGYLREPSDSRLTIGLLISDPEETYQALIWSGVADVAQERGANLLCFAGGPLPGDQRSVIYDLVHRENVDGLVILSGALGHLVDLEEIHRFCQRFHPIPMVSVAIPLETTPSVLVDNKSGMRDAVAHLIEAHGYRRIAFVRGPKGHPEAEDRYRAYADVLAEHNLPLDSNLVAPGTFGAFSGRQAVALLMEERGLLPQSDFEALVAADDETALGAMEALQERGVRVPDDVALVGFDDVQEARYITPPLTTVRQPMHELGRQAAEMLLALLAGEPVLERLTLPTELVLRRSCGCLAPQIAQATTESVTPPAQESFEDGFARRWEGIVFEMTQSLRAPTDNIIATKMRDLLQAFSTDLKEETPTSFLPALEGVLRYVETVDGDVAACQGAISVLRRHAQPYLADDDKTWFRAESLWQQARVMIGEMAQRVQGHRLLRSMQQAETLRTVVQPMISTFEVATLAQALAAGLPSLTIRGCYVSLYEGSDTSADRSLLVLAYDEPRLISVDSSRRQFPSRQLAPRGVLPQERPYSLLIEPLHFEDQQIGFVSFEAGAQHASACETLRGQISSSLRGMLLLQAHQRAEKALEQHTSELEARGEELEKRSEELDAFAHTVAHDLKGPLGPIVGYADFLEVHYTALSEEDVRRLLRTMGESAAKMGNIIDELLLLATIRGLADVEAQPLDMGSIVAESLVRMSYVIEERGAEIILPPDGAWPDSLGHGPWVEQVWINYISNALKYGGQPPRLELGADPLSALSKEGKGAMVRFWVRDNGRGLVPQEQDQLFTQFTRLDRVRATGHGLGLSIVLRIVEKLGGQVGVESESGSGSAFWFTLPAVAVRRGEE